MSAVTATSVARQIESLFDGASVAGLTDRQLIERFIARPDAAGEAAFAAIVNRHGPMVMDICRQVLTNPHDAEDAFQAVFLILACRARSIRDPDLLGSWLYAVALRTARKARTRITRRRKNDELARAQRSAAGPITPIDPSVPSPEYVLISREQAEILYGAIDRLPPSFRLPILLHYFEGLTVDQTANRLRCPAGTVRSRLARACDKLRRGLMRRGVALSATVVASALESRSASASVSSGLCETTAHAAVNFAARRAAVAGTLSAPAIGLAREVSRSMLLAKSKSIAVMLVFLGAMLAGAGFAVQTAEKRAGEPKLQDRQAGKPDLQEAAASAAGANAQPAPGRMFVVGRVLDPQGQPVPNASVLVYARTTPIQVDGPEDRGYAKEIGHARSDDTGRIRVDVPRTTSATYDRFGAVALAPGYGAGWTSLSADAVQPVADITLPPEQIIHGRAFDLLGQPAANVRVSVTAIGRMDPSVPNQRLASLEGPAFWWAHADDLAGWPRTVVSRPDGRFTVRGVGRGFRAFLTVIEPRFVTQLVQADTDEASLKKPLSIALQPARTLSGRVTYADTGKPVRNVRVTVGAVTATTDVEGRYRANPRAGRVRVSALAPTGEPYLDTSQLIQWPKGAITHSIDLALKRGVLIRGTVTERPSHRPVPGAFVELHSPDSADDGAQDRLVKTSADGTFVFAARSRRGYIVVDGPTSDYVVREFDERLVTGGQPTRPPSGPPIYCHAFLDCDQKSGDADHDISLTLQACDPIKGHVVGPDGKPITGAWVFSGLHIGTRVRFSRQWNARYHAVTHNGEFELHGLAQDAEVSVSLLEPKLKLGATVRISGKQDAREPIVVKLEPCVTATARLVGPDGKPLGHFTPRAGFLMVVAPGKFSELKDRKEGTLTPKAGALTVIDPVNYPAPPASDGDGRIVFPALIPGTIYHFADRSNAGAPPRTQFRKEFTVKSGETLDLGDFPIQKPGKAE